MAKGSWCGSRQRIAVGFFEDDWIALNSLAKAKGISVTKLIHDFTIKGLKETA